MGARDRVVLVEVRRDDRERVAETSVTVADLQQRDRHALALQSANREKLGLGGREESGTQVRMSARKGAARERQDLWRVVLDEDSIARGGAGVEVQRQDEKIRPVLPMLPRLEPPVLTQLLPYVADTLNRLRGSVHEGRLPQAIVKARAERRPQHECDRQRRHDERHSHGHRPRLDGVAERPATPGCPGDRRHQPCEKDRMRHGRIGKPRGERVSEKPGVQRDAKHGN